MYAYYCNVMVSIIKTKTCHMTKGPLNGYANNWVVTTRPFFHTTQSLKNRYMCRYVFGVCT
ncbi:hypothetical protein Hanom_Chr04g00341371 [Helianthus anomalus]